MSNKGSSIIKNMEKESNWALKNNFEQKGSIKKSNQGTTRAQQ